MIQSVQLDHLACVLGAALEDQILDLDTYQKLCAMLDEQFAEVIPDYHSEAWLTMIAV